MDSPGLAASDLGVGVFVGDRTASAGVNVGAFVGVLRAVGDTRGVDAGVGVPLGVTVLSGVVVGGTVGDAAGSHMSAKAIWGGSGV